MQSNIYIYIGISHLYYNKKFGNEYLPYQKSSNIELTAKGYYFRGTGESIYLYKIPKNNLSIILNKNDFNSVFIFTSKPQCC